MGKRGPKRRNGPREPNGQLSRRKDFRDMEAEETMSTVTQARLRHHGDVIASVQMAAIDDRDTPAPDWAVVARDQRMETAVGRWCMSGELSRNQYDAAMQYVADAQAYRRSVPGPRDDHAQDMDAIGGYDGADTTERDKKAEAKFMAAVAAVMECSLTQSGNVAEAIAECVLRDVDNPRRVGEVRLGLNALARHYGITGELRRRAG